MSTLFRLTFLAVLLTFAMPQSLRAAGKEETPLGEQMDKMKRDFKGLRKALEAPVDADKAKYVKLAANFRAAAEASKKFDPAKTETLPKAQQAAFVAEYHQAMDKLIKLSGELEKQLAAGQWDNAGKQLKLIGKAQREGHKQFRVEKD